MGWKPHTDIIFLFLILIAAGLFVLNLFTGEITIIWEELWVEKQTISKQIVFNHRLPKTIAAILTGLCLPISGWILQEFFKNPLAGPSILGISTASALFVSAAIIFGTTVGLTSILNLPTISLISSLLGSTILVVILLIASYNTSSSTSLIIIGFMFSTICGAAISLIQFWSDSKQLKEVLIWSLGNLQGLSWLEITLFTGGTFIGLVFLIKLIPMLAKMQLGIDYGQSYGVNIKTYRIITIISASILTATATAFVGPIVFVGLAVPHICRATLNTANFYKLCSYVGITGVVFLLSITIVPDILGIPSLPINVITSIIGAPIVISIVLNQKSNFL